MDFAESCSLTVSTECLSKIFAEVASFHWASVTCREGNDGKWRKKVEEKLDGARNMLNQVSNEEITIVFDELIREQRRTDVVASFLFRYMKERFERLVSIEKSMTQKK